MKTKLTAMFSIAMMVILIASSESHAQASDTLVVSATPPGNLNTVITANPGKVFVLQQTGSTDTSYQVTATTKTSNDVTIIGKPNPVTGHLPVIEPAILADNSSPSTFFTLTSGNKITFKNLYFLGWRTDNTTTAKELVSLNADSSTLRIDHCVIDGWNADVLNIGASHCNLFVTNTEFRDIALAGAGPAWVGGARPLDTLDFVNNTFFDCKNSYFGDMGYVGYFRFEHNTCFLNEYYPIRVPQMTNGIIRNNIFYGTAAYGVDSSGIVTFPTGGRGVWGWPIFFLDTLSTLKSAPYNLTEADRKDTVENNVYFWPQAFYTYWNTVSDSSHVPGQITPPVFMDPQTASMFNGKSTWPGLHAADNDSVDPGFSSSLVTPGVDSLIKVVNILWTNGNNDGGYRPCPLPTDPLNVYAGVPQNWAATQGYPVRENFRYSNKNLQHAGTDGKALGDLNWFPEQITDVKQISNAVPAKFTLSQNYPNPFNPTTMINYSIVKSGFVSLKVYNVLGQEVAALYEGFQKAGSYKYNFDASRLSSGVYFYRLQANGFSETRKMIFLK